MLYSISGKLEKKGDSFIVISVHGLGIKVYVPQSFFELDIPIGGTATLFTYLHIKEGALDLYGFVRDDENAFFNALISVSGVGPKSAMGILNTSSVDRLSAAVAEGDAALFQKAAGIGRKTAERIVLELKEKVSLPENREVVSRMKKDEDVFEALVGLGYQRKKAREVLAQIDANLRTTDERLRDALKKIRA